MPIFIGVARPLVRNHLDGHVCRNELGFFEGEGARCRDTCVTRPGRRAARGARIKPCATGGMSAHTLFHLGTVLLVLLCLGSFVLRTAVPTFIVGLIFTAAQTIAFRLLELDLTDPGVLTLLGVSLFVHLYTVSAARHLSA